MPQGKFADMKGKNTMYRSKLAEIVKEKHISIKQLAEESGVSVDTISRIIHPENPEKDSPRVNTLEDICKVLGVEVWELFYIGDRSLVALQAEIGILQNERDQLIAEAAVQKASIDELTRKVHMLKDELLDVYRRERKQK
jgi:transcriptional regulator with XRE-family HTH domain